MAVRFRGEPPPGSAMIARVPDSAAGLLLPALLLLALSALVAVQTGALRLPALSGASFAPELLTIAPRAFWYRDSGDYLSEGVPVDAPIVERTPAHPLEIMKYQVGVTDYARCVDAGACKPAEPRHKVLGNVPITGVSFTDAEAYARWLTGLTGQNWRLPTIEEWAFVAGSRAVDSGLGVATDGANPAERWLAFYAREAALGTDASAAPEPFGTFGLNEFGVADLSGSVWEWTATCNSRTRLDANGGVISHIEACGVRFLEGRHRTPMSSFIRDGRSGGCSVQAPPDNLGFRLVRDRPWHAAIVDVMRGLFG